ncbi:FAD-dependent oxidoreductase [Leyella stercorea]|uniref:FAD-dependent oxidoreductase n=2 Tax=Leyella stercorea TaxID=363265 RepID=UPI00242F7AC5|nr:FAD-dependent oxidoreductase [Leyella stercorea]
MKYIIVGGVAGGATAAARIRRLTEDAEIVLFEKGEHISYANCGLPYYIGGVIEDRDRLFVQTPEAFGKRFNIDVRILSEVIAIDAEAKQVTVHTADGKEYVESYDKLLLSPGASPVVPPLEGIDSKGIFTLRNVSDTDRIKAYMAEHKVKRAVIVGGGFIGLEMAENLKHAGAQVAVVEMANQVMAPIDFSMAALVHEHLQQQDVRLCLEQAVEGFSREGHELTVHFKSGVSLKADMVLLSIGVRAETRLAQTAGLKIGEMRGICVDEYLQTSHEHIYAVGDAIEFPHPITGKPWLNFLAGPANRQARIVADNMVLGNRLKYEGSVGTSIAKVFDITVASTGLPAKRLKQMEIPYLSATIHSGSHAGYYPGSRQMDIKITFSPSDGRLYGAQIVGYEGVDTRINQYALAIKTGATVDDLTRLEHAYAPPFSSAKDPVAISGYVAGNILAGKMTPLYWRELEQADTTKVILVDVRTADEYALGTIGGAVNIPLDDLRERMGEIPTDVPVWLFCGVGLRGYLASNILKANGYRDVRNLIGGLKTYRAATAKLVAPADFDTAADSHSSEAAVHYNHSCETSVCEGGKTIVRVDACGIQCPGPILKMKQAMDGLAPGEQLEVRATDAAFPRDAEAWCRTTGNRFLGRHSESGVYIAMIEKTTPCAVEASKPQQGDSGKTLILFSDDLDKVLATFVLANGAAATGRKVSIFFTFWGLNAIKKTNRPKVAKDFFGRMFSWMLPSDSTRLALSKMNMMGMGAKMMRYLMRKKGVDSLEELRQQAVDNGVEFIACQMSMDVMGVRREELLDNVTVGGVATYMERAEKANVNLFI